MAVCRNSTNNHRNMVDDPSSTSLHGNLKLLLFNSIVEIAVTLVNHYSRTAHLSFPSFYFVIHGWSDVPTDAAVRAEGGSFVGIEVGDCFGSRRS